MVTDIHVYNGPLRRGNVHGHEYVYGCTFNDICYIDSNMLIM
jgi:hypothetical protein